MDLTKESDLQADLITLLGLHGIKPFVQRTDKRSRGTRGWPDLTFAYCGIPVVWEAKQPNKKPRPEQEQLHNMLRSPRNGWHVEVIHSLEEAEADLKILDEMTPYNRFP